MPPSSGASTAGITAGSRTSTSTDRKSTRLNSSHSQISYAVFCLKKKKESVSALLTAVQTLHGSALTCDRDRGVGAHGRTSTAWQASCAFLLPDYTSEVRVHMSV